MKIHEYQAKELFRRAGVPVPASHVAATPEEAAAAFRQLGQPLAVVKAQIHAGGRGKGTILDNPSQRGVQLVRSDDEAFRVASALLGHKLVTVQTGPEGKTVQRVLVEAGCRIERELYLGIVLDRSVALPVVMASSEGGVEIEKVAQEHPEKIYKEHFDPARGIQPYQICKLCKKLQLSGAAARAATSFFSNLCRFFVQNDCSLVEVNPLVVDAEGDLLTLDAKVNFDDNAAFRHPEWQALRDLTEEEPAELKAAQAGLSYVKMDGNIGCLVNGAGLAMATMDIIKYYGGEPANFLDVGGGANTEQVIEAFRILLADRNVRAVLVNIFGGIMKCTTIAQALLEAYRTVGFSVPLVVRLEGTEVEQGRHILSEAGVNIITATDLADAAEKVVQAALGGP